MSILKNLSLQTLVVILMAILGFVPLSFSTKHEGLGFYVYPTVNLKTEINLLDNYAMSEPFSSGPMITFRSGHHEENHRYP